jgi:hypothetical protein
MHCLCPWNCSTYVSNFCSFFDTGALPDSRYCGIACDVLQLSMLVTTVPSGIRAHERIESLRHALVSTRAEAAQDRAIEDDVMNAINNSFNDTRDHTEAATAAGGSSSALAAHPEVCALGYGERPLTDSV